MPIRFRLSVIRNFVRGPLMGVFTLGACLTGWADAESDCPAPVATCTFPPAARHSSRHITYFHTSGIVSPLGHSESECAEPIATCIQPAPQVSRLADGGPLRLTEGASTVGELLRDWATASATRAAWTPAEKKWLARRHQPWLSAVALDAVMRLSSSVSEQDLSRDFTWSTGESQDDDIAVLHAVPTDETQRLFCPQLRVELDVSTHTMLAIDVADRAGTWRPIDLPWAVMPKSSRGGDTIILTAERIEVDAADSTDLPPSPQAKPTIRFAAGVIEIRSDVPR